MPTLGNAMHRCLWIMASCILIGCGSGASGPVIPPPPPSAPPPAPPPPPPPAPSPTYDIDALGVPRFVSAQYLDLTKVAQISRFRSAIGHDYHDDLETCRSMKHYFMGRSGADWSTIPIYAPVSGTITLTRVEQLGTQILIRATAQPAFTFIIFHVTPTTPVAVGTVVTQGQQLGWHVGSQTMSDVAVGVDTPSGYRLVSWFDVITDGLFASYSARGLNSRAAAVITRAERNADPLTCSGETFTSGGILGGWVVLD